MDPKTFNRIKKCLLAAILSVMAGVLVTVNIRGAVKVPAKADGLYFQDISLDTFQGGRYTAADVFQNRLTVFHVWNPYCTACLREMPLLSALDKEYAEKGVRIVGIEGDAYLYPEDIEKARTLAGGNGLVQLLADRTFTEEILPLINNGYPCSFLVDGHGIIRDRRAGTMSETEWRTWLDTALLLSVNTAG